MTDVETLEERVSTVERAVTDGDHGFPAVDDLAGLTERVEALEDEVAELSDHADELDAATQALRGYVGNVRSVNERVEGRADAALAATERLERRLDATVEERRPVDAEGRPSGTGTVAEPRSGGEPTDGNRGSPVGGTGEPLSRIDTTAQTDEDGTSDAATDSRDPGVLERIRSLL